MIDPDVVVRVDGLELDGQGGLAGPAKHRRGIALASNEVMQIEGTSSPKRTRHRKARRRAGDGLLAEP